MVCLFFERPENFEAWGAVCFSWTWASMPPVGWWSMWFSLILLLHRRATLVACNKNTQCGMGELEMLESHYYNLKHAFFRQFWVLALLEACRVEHWTMLCRIFGQLSYATLGDPWLLKHMSYKCCFKGLVISFCKTWPKGVLGFGIRH